MNPADTAREAELKDSIVISPSGKMGRIVVVSVMLDFALLDVLDEDLNPTGQKAMLKTLANIRRKPLH